MASSSGTKYSGEFPPRSLSRRMSRMGTFVYGEAPEDEPGAINAERVPSSLAKIVPVLRVADEIQDKNATVAYLCRFHAFEMAHKLDPTSTGRGVRQFKTALLHKLEKDEREGPQPSKSYAREMQKFYQDFYVNNIEGQLDKKPPEEMAKNCQIASVLFDVLSNLTGNIYPEILRYSKEVEKIKEQFVPYNILPLHATATTFAIMEVPEIKAAVKALRKVHNLPRPDSQPSVHATHGDCSSHVKHEEREKPVHDLFDWLCVIFGFQKANVENQREHLVLLLANGMTKNKAHQEHNMIDDVTVKYLMDKMLKNYHSWCNYLHRKSSIKYSIDIEKQQMQLLYLGLYLLIWDGTPTLWNCMWKRFSCYWAELATVQRRRIISEGHHYSDL